MKRKLLGDQSSARPQGIGMEVLRNAMFAAVLLAGGMTAQAAEPGREALVADFTQATGVEAVIESSLRQAEQMVADQQATTVDNLRRAGLSEPALAEVGVAFDAFAKRVLRSWATDEAARIYAGAIAASMSDEDLRKSVEFFRSSEGQRSLGAAADANTKLQAYIQSSMAQVMGPALKDFTDQVQAITKTDLQRRGQLPD